MCGRPIKVEDSYSDSTFEVSIRLFVLRLIGKVKDISAALKYTPTQEVYKPRSIKLMACIYACTKTP